MKIICQNCGQSYSERFGACPLCGAEPEKENPADEFFQEALKEPETGTIPPALPALEKHTEEPKPTEPVRRRGDPDSGEIHRFAFGEDDDDATAHRPVKPAPQPRRYYEDAPEGADSSYSPRYARPRSRADRIPVWMVVTISVVLGIALIVGGLTLAYAMGVFDREEQAPPDNSQNLQVNQPADVTPQQPDQPTQSGDEDHTTVGTVTVDEDPDTFPTIETVDGNDQPKEPDEPKRPEVTCDSIRLDNVDFTLAFRGDHYTITATTEPEDAAQYVTWESSDPTVATVDERGRVEARSKGTVTVTAVCGERTAKCIVRCEQLPPADTMINLSAEDITIANARETAKLTILDQLTSEELAGMTWTSSKPEVASVDENGVVTALSGGMTTITAQSGERIGTCLVRCAFTGDGSYKISHSDVTMSYIGEYFNLYITHEGVKMTEVTWFTSDSNVASVNDQGVVTAVGTGTATITTVVDGNSLQCIVRVRDGS